MLLSLAYFSALGFFDFLKNLTNHILNTTSPTPLLFTHKPLVQVAADALVKDWQATTPTTILKPKNKRNSETRL